MRVKGYSLLTRIFFYSILVSKYELNLKDKEDGKK